MVSELNNNEYLKQHAAVAPLPKGENGTCSMYNGLAWSASAQGKHTEEAWKLMEYLGSKEAQQKQAELGVTMAAYDGISEAWSKSQEGFDLTPYLDMMDGAVLYPHSKNTTVWYTVMNELLVNLWDGSRPAEDICAEFTEFMNEALANEQ